MYEDLLREHLNTINNIQIDERFQGIYKPEEKSSSSSDDEQDKFGSKNLSSRKKEKLINYLFGEINTSR